MRDLAAQWAICAFPAIGALMAVWLACLLRERGIRPLRALARLMRRPHWEALAVLACVGGLVHHGATKHVASSPSGPDSAMAAPDTPLAAQAEADSGGPSPGWTNAACGVCATGISPGETSILIRAHWPSPPAGGASGVEVYARPRLDAGGWSGVGTARSSRDARCWTSTTTTGISQAIRISYRRGRHGNGSDQRPCWAMPTGLPVTRAVPRRGSSGLGLRPVRHWATRMRG